MTTLTWTDWPAPRQPARSALAAALILASVLVTASIDPWLAVVGAVALVVSTSEALLPTRYELGEDGLGLFRPFTRRRVPWARFETFRQTPEGFVVAGPRRSVVLRSPPDPAAVAAALSSHLRGATCAS